MLGVLDWARRDLIVHTSRTKRSLDFIALLEEVDRRYGPKVGVAIKPIVLVLDNGPIHTSKASRAALAERAHWLTVEWLPKYAPELNDIEGVWRDLKRHHLAHQTFTGPDDLTARSIKPSSRSTPNETAIRGTTSKLACRGSGRRLLG
jgi:transposase